MTEEAASPERGFWAGFTRVVVALRWVLVPAWILGAVAATLYLPSFSSAAGSTTSGILPGSSPAMATEIAAVKKFGFPLLSQEAVVQYEPGGLSAAAQAEVVARAARIDLHALPGVGQISGAIPVLNTAGVFPSSRGEGTTAITFLLFKPSVSTGARQAAVHTLVTRYLSSPGDGYRGVTGTSPATESEGSSIGSALKIIELAAILVVFLVVLLAFRSLGAAVIALSAVGVAYFTAVRVLAVAANFFGFALPGELEALIVVLLVGIVTDYSIFFLSVHRREYGTGAGPADAARRSGMAVIPIVAVAGTTVAAGTATLLIAKLSLYGELGPGMAISAMIGMIVSITYLPAALAVAGRLAFWPFDHPRRRYEAEATRHESGWHARLTRFTVGRVFAALILVGGVVALLAALSPLLNLRLGLNIVSDLPPTTGPARALAAASRGFAPGVVAPTEIVVSDHGINSERAGLVKVQDLLSAQQGVAGVIGPADQPTKYHFGLFVDPAGNAARYIVILDHNPYGSAGIATLDRLRAAMPSLLAQGGLGNAHAGFAGDTAIASELTHETRSGALRIGGALLAVDLLILVLFLRSLIAPLCLLAVSLLSVLGAIGITTWVFQSGAGGLTGPGGGSLTFFVPTAVGVLLLSFGSDYNIFLVGRIWEASDTRTLREAIVAAVPRASSTITKAGIALTLTFALLALIPLRSFRSFAFAMVVGIVLDTFLVRSFLVPALLSTLGKWAAWPNRRLMADLERARP